jgi:lysyl-tRNA synthetase, class I
MDKENIISSNNGTQLHWAFTSARNTMAQHGDLDKYVCASGITPSGIIHIGNFREAMTVDLVKRAFKIMGKNAVHIHSWDNFDVFRKVPKDMPKQDLLSQHLRMSIVDVPDTDKGYNSYAERNLKAVEDTLPLVGINPEYRYQAEMYKKCLYADDIKKALENTDKIKSILNKYRTEPLADDWLPTSIFCDSCKKDIIIKQEWKGGYDLYYECECGHKETFDIRKKGIVKLLWRVDWPMRWNYEKVNFEPGGKDHSMPGSSYETGKQISKEIWDRIAPNYTMYDFLSIKGRGGKISSSAGDVVTLKDCLEIYQPEIIRYLFAGTRPNTEFAISFDQDVIKIYEDYDKCERIYYGEEQVNDKNKEKNKWIYELSQIDDDLNKIPKTKPVSISFREVTTLLCIKDMNETKVYDFFKYKINTDFEDKRVRTRISCAKNWLIKFADDNFKFHINKNKNEDFFNTLDENQKNALSMLKDAITSAGDTEDLNTKLFDIPQKLGMEMKEFFRISYQSIISKDKGPKLAGFIDEIGRENILKLL